MEELEGWVRKHGGGLHPAVEAAEDAESGWGFRVKEGRRLGGGEAVVVCPVGVTMSFINVLSGSHPAHADASRRKATESAFLDQFPRDSHPFPASFLASVPPHVVSRFLLIKEYLLGTSSFWHPYISTLPQPDRPSAWALPPAGWAKDDAELLEDTNVGNAVEEVKARLKTEFKHAASVLKASSSSSSFAGTSVEEEDRARAGPAPGEYTRALFNWAYAIFTSRSFRPSRVIPPGDLPLLKSVLPEGVKVDDFAVLMPLFDVGNHSPSAEVEWDFEPREMTRASGPGALVGLKIHRGSGGYAAGQQVFNNYGDKTNAELLMAYGFAVPESESLHNDYVHLRLRTAESGGHDRDQDARPREFLFSLRPVTDPSSVSARKRLLIPDVRTQDVIAAFRLVEDSLVWELVSLQTTPEQREAMLPLPAEVVSKVGVGVGAGESQGQGPGEFSSAVEGTRPLSDLDKERLRLVLTGRTGPEFRPVLEQTMAIIQAKALQELEKLEQSDFEMDEGFEATRVQTLALQYRSQCRKVLIGVLEALEMPGEEGEDGEGGP